MIKTRQATLRFFKNLFHSTESGAKANPELPTAYSSITYKKSSATFPAPICQGEVLAKVIETNRELDSIGQETVLIAEKTHPYAIVVSQDCDLEQDYKMRYPAEGVTVEVGRLIPNILFCEVVTATELKSAGGMNSKIWPRVQRNKDERYHFLQKEFADTQAEGLPELGIDFKRYFTIPTDEVYKHIELGNTIRHAVLVSPYLEHLSGRFAFYLGRVALPYDHASDS